jgi:hypothetical protein
MDIYAAIQKIEKFLETYPDEHGDEPAVWAPTESKLLPSGDDNDTIKIWFNFGPGVDEKYITRLLDQFEEAVTLDHPEIKRYSLELRGDAF